MFDEDMKAAVILEEAIVNVVVKLIIADKPALIILRDLLTEWEAETNFGGASKAEKLWFRATETLIEHHLLELKQEDPNERPT